MNRKDFRTTGEVVGSTFKATISTDSVDRDGEVMVPQGMNAKDYERNPVLLWNHDPAQPIGRAISLRRGENAIEAEFVFAARPDDYDGDWFPDYVRGLVAANVVKAVSIGFVAMEGNPRIASKGDVEKYGSEVRRVYSKWKLLEVSVVSVPANQDALITAVRKGFVSRSAAEKFGSIVVPVSTPLERKTISVIVPRIGTVEASRIAREEIAKASGKVVV